MKIILDKFPDLSEKQISQFSKLKDLYTYWNDKINVISRKDIENIYLRHILHSLAIAKFINFKNGTTVLDLGTGGGFPGIPLSIIFPNTNFILSDSIKKKIKVVDELIKDLKLENVMLICSRAEDLDIKYDFLVTRAVAKMDKIIKWSKGNFNHNSNNDIPNGIIALKGGDIHQELSCLKSKKIVEIKNFFDFNYFKDKKLIYVPANLTC